MDNIRLNREEWSTDVDSDDQNNYVAERAVKLLYNNIERIENVNKWAKLVGYSRSWLLKNIREEFGVSPKILLREARYVTILKSLKNNPHATSYSVAKNAGLKNDQSVYKFLSNHFQTDFTTLRQEFLKHY